MRTLLLTIAFAAAMAAHAQERFDLDRLLGIAARSHPRIEGMRSDREAAAARQTISLAPFRPRLSLNAYGAIGRSSMTFPNSIEPANYSLLPQSDVAVGNATLMWSLYSFGRDRKLADAGRAEIAAADAAILAEELDVRLGVETAFADALLKRDITAAHQVALEAAQQVEKLTQIQFEAGKVPQAFVFRSQADTAKAERDLALAKAGAEAARASVWEAAGLDQSSDRDIGDWNAILDAPNSMSEAISQALARRPELTALHEKLKAVKAQHAATSASKLPELSLMAMYDQMAARGMPGQNGFKAGLVLSFPLVDGGERGGMSREFNAMDKRLGSEARAMQNKIAAEVASAWAEWNTVAAVKKAAASERKSSEEAYRVALIRYEEGKSVLAELTDSRSQLTHANLSVAEATAFERNAWSKLVRYTALRTLRH